MRKKLTLFDHHVNFRDVHVHNSAGTDVEMSHFAVAHLSRWKANMAAAGVHQRIREVEQQKVIGRLARERDRIRFGFGAVSPAIQNDENERSIFHSLVVIARQSARTAAMMTCRSPCRAACAWRGRRPSAPI